MLKPPDALSRASRITPAQIRAQHDRWLTVGPRMRQRGKECQVEHNPLAASSVNHRLRAIPVDTLEALFAVLPPRKTTARLKVLRWTGLPAKTLMRLKLAGVDLESGVMFLPGRKKGKGTQSLVLPL